MISILFSPADTPHRVAFFSHQLTHFNMATYVTDGCARPADPPAGHGFLSCLLLFFLSSSHSCHSPVAFTPVTPPAPSRTGTRASTAPTRRCSTPSSSTSPTGSRATRPSAPSTPSSPPSSQWQSRSFPFPSSSSLFLFPFLPLSSPALHRLTLFTSSFPQQKRLRLFAVGHEHHAAGRLGVWLWRQAQVPPQLWARCAG